MAQDNALSRHKHRFESGTGYCFPNNKRRPVQKLNGPDQTPKVAPRLLIRNLLALNRKQFVTTRPRLLRGLVASSDNDNDYIGGKLTANNE